MEKGDQNFKGSKSLAEHAERHALMSRIKTQKAKQGQSSSLGKGVIEVKNKQ